MTRIYFAHAVSDYNTDWERAALARINEMFPAHAGFDIVNPNGEEHDAAYKEQGMAYFHDLCKGCDGVIWAPFPDDSVGAGVYSEVTVFASSGKTVYALDRALGIAQNVKPDLTKVLDVEGTRAKIRHYRSLPQV